MRRPDAAAHPGTDNHPIRVPRALSRRCDDGVFDQGEIEQMSVLAATWGVGQVVWSVLWITIFVLWLMLVFRVFADIFRSSMSGIAKILWLVLVIITPFIGVFIYLIVRGGEMARNEVAAAAAQEERVQTYIREAAGTGASPAAELERLAGLRDKGVIDEDEFARLKAKILS